MEPGVHSINSLFRQLGLPDGDKEIERFILSHQPIPNGVCLQDANFWSSSQADFLREAISEDADWAEVVDELDARLHNSPLKAQPGKPWLSENCRAYLPEMLGY
ncbi:hypothetical protein FHR99_000026 [Litorivivens lipolytica]|uniref:DUF2789 domain-containing protein n=1 Tax=Litorivivens lipolytica TaxID=1524264 RepID=A0A7W4W1P9_9GAMM|nr:DUF2789 domain-containing protein [Litorivivens lipolytica]MBB3045790.1 hypothetical protein [Litorivivens lipolytica]